MNLTLEQQEAIRGVSVIGDSVIIYMRGGIDHGNNNARQLCGELIDALDVQRTEQNINELG